jgi:tetratricopeptide (TPR) repeat protein
MGLSHKSVCLSFVGLICVYAPAQAFVQVLGNGRAHACFLAAKSGINVDSGVSLCTSALAEDEMSSHDRAGTYVNRGVMESAKGQVEEAMADYNASIMLMPNLGDAYIDRGTALITLKRYDEALEDINKGISLEMSYPHLGYFNRAVAEELMGRYQDSYYDFKHVLELEPNFTLAIEQLRNFTVTRKSNSS